MKKHLILLACTLFFTSLLPAQPDDFPAVVVSSQGKVQYNSADKAVSFKITPGAVIKKTGALKIKGNGSAVVYCNGRLQQLKGKGTYALPEVFKGGLASLNFDPEFGKYVRASVEFAGGKQAGDGWGTVVTDPKKGGDGWGTVVTDPKKGGDGWGTVVTDPKKGGDGWGTVVTDPKKGGDGWGGEGVNIVPILPFGKLAPGVVQFVWSRPAGANSYQLEILDDDGKSLHSTTVADTFASVDLQKLNLTPNQIYSWKVSVPGNAKLESPLREFTISSPEAQVEATKRATTTSTYRDGSPALRGMMEAIALEKAEWYNAAGQQYETLLKQYPEDNMVRMMCSAFWMRYGLEPKAKAVITGK
ncbi:MAG: hypothetical protein L6Q97_07890 [Thermoanaerobaculia bacterium]|nr:hypothetical protein [Thermoanaerobaculia bacterium]